MMYTCLLCGMRTACGLLGGFEAISHELLLLLLLLLLLQQV